MVSTARICPEVSPFFHRRFREREAEVIRNYGDFQPGLLEGILGALGTP